MFVNKWRDISHMMSANEAKENLKLQGVVNEAKERI